MYFCLVIDPTQSRVQGRLVGIGLDLTRTGIGTGTETLIGVLDIFCSARSLVKRHGLEGADDHAAKRIAHLKEQNDPEGARVWEAIRAALTKLAEGTEPGDLS